MGLSVETLVLAKKYTDEQIKNSGGGGGADSADLAALKEYIDLPFEESFSDTLTLDGDSTGLTLYSSYYKILDIEITEENLANGGSYSLFNLSNETTQIWTFTIDDITPYLENPSILSIKGGTIIIVIEDNNFLGVDFTKGIYVDKLFYGDTALVSRITSLTINGFNKFSSRVLKDSYLPEIEVSWNDLNDKPFYETDPIETVILPETTLEYYYDNYEGAYLHDYLIVSIPIELNSQYKVIIDGITYDNLVCFEEGGRYIIGEPYETFNSETPNYPFRFYTNFNGSENHIVCNLVPSMFEISTSHTITVMGYISEIIQLDEKYLPKFAGLKVTGNTYTIDSENIVADEGAEVFNDYTDNIATGYCSHAEGCQTKANGYISHTEGGSTTASGMYSHAEGYGTIANGNSQHVQGEYNIEDTNSDYAHIVGNGTWNSKSNAHTLDWDGNAWFAGDVFIGGTGQDDESAEKLVTESDLNNRVTPTALMLADINTGIQYKIQVVDGKLTMTEVTV